MWPLPIPPKSTSTWKTKMRWPARARGSQVCRLKFAWMPKRIRETMIWLEFYKATYELKLLNDKLSWVVIQEELL